MIYFQNCYNIFFFQIELFGLQATAFALHFLRTELWNQGGLISFVVSRLPHIPPALSFWPSLTSPTQRLDSPTTAACISWSTQWTQHYSPPYPVGEGTPSYSWMSFLRPESSHCNRLTRTDRNLMTLIHVKSCIWGQRTSTILSQMQQEGFQRYYYHSLHTISTMKGKIKKNKYFFFLEEHVASSNFVIFTVRTIRMKMQN